MTKQNGKMMEYQGYHATFEYDGEDKIFIGKVHGLSDSLNFHGTSVDELEKMFHQSVDNYILFCKQIGKEPEKEYSGSFNVRISPEMHREVAQEALKKGETINSIIKYAIEEYLAKDNVKQITCYYPVIFSPESSIEPNRFQNNSKYTSTKEGTIIWKN